jgi:S-adenosylmethionine:tRNA ribosyltransferase-isomerase
MRLSDFDYHLPPELIAQHPAAERDQSRLMVIDRRRQSVEHRHFHEISQYFNAGDMLALNDSRVIHARLNGVIESSGRRAEVLLLKRMEDGAWEALVKPGRRLMPGSRVTVAGIKPGVEGDMTVSILSAGEGGLRSVSLGGNVLPDGYGSMPLPPYIHARLDDDERYQTVYSRPEGSAAAPTAGLHFTAGLLDGLKSKGVNTAFVTLHVGLDTFRPVRAEDPSRHHIHTEYGLVSRDAADLINDTHSRGKRVVAVGTTSVRLIEAASPEGRAGPFEGQVGLFILPGYRFQVTDAMVTNFHLPKSTLLMMVSAFAGREFILDCYEVAKKEGYRFFSFGDAMLII